MQVNRPPELRGHVDCGADARTRRRMDVEALLETERFDVELERPILVGDRYADCVHAGKPCR